MARAALLSLVGLLLSQAACAARTLMADAPPGLDGGRGAHASVVDCLLPSQVRKLGLTTPYLAPQQAVRTSVEECTIRGGRAFHVARARAPEPLTEVADAPVAGTGAPQTRRRAEPRVTVPTDVPASSGER